MKQADNNEVDLLLRALARRARDVSPSPGASTSGSANSHPSDHLDADELNSYAEGVLSASERARYTEHVADCTRCRRILVGLTQAASAPRPYEVLAGQRRLSFWHKFSPFFSGPVLRYAVPALALTAVIAISMVALRQQRRTELVAQNQPTNSSAALSESGSTKLSPSNEALPTQASSTPQRGIESKQNSEGIREKKDAPVVGEIAQAPGTSAGTNEISSSSLAKDSSQSGQSAGIVELRPSYAPEPPPAAAPLPPRPMRDEADKVRSIQKEQPVSREDQERQREQEKDQPRDTTTSPGPSKAGVATFKTGRIEQLPAGTTESRSGGKARNESRDEGETKNVSGRHFRRQGNSWIDTAYESSRATINVARGSEQFRSLVADEPGLRAIAQQLGGEVIVVWKGRAYRIY
ncbi:MAG: zf-HC2 domain-containing protein [Pyrinomonadaceae bacterium]